MFKVKEEHDNSKRYNARLVLKGFQQKRGVDYNEIFSSVVKMTTISKGFQLAGQKENLECILKEILYGLIQAPRLQYLNFDSFMQKDKVDDMLVIGSDMAEFNKPKWVLIFVEDSWNEEPCSDVHRAGDEIEVEVLRSFNWPSSELIAEDGVLPKRSYSQFNDVSSGYLRVLDVRRYRKVRAVTLLKGMWFEVYRDYLRRSAVK
ncbi:retrovirus-related pol polyprotein from transposon TNT 1-94 [Tanacetum coccineum]